MRLSIGMLIGAAAFAGLSGAIAQSQQPAQPTQPSHAGEVPAAAKTAAAGLPDGPGKDKLLASCSSCHEPQIVIGQHHTLDEWKELIDQMIARGAQVSDADHEVIAAYLAKTQS